tara:strand:+ start:420 stop:701 length:282 start_codon:yes stop_codon:yes gene_type:complete
MAYSEKTKQLIADAPPSLGTNLAQWAVQRGVSVQQVATATGATRQTVYNWFTGTTLVTPAYQEKVLTILDILKSISKTDDAWKKICAVLKLHF